MQNYIIITTTGMAMFVKAKNLSDACTQVREAGESPVMVRLSEV